MRLVAPTLAVALGLLTSPVEAQEKRDPELERGMALVREGQYAEAIITLDAVARRLTREPARRVQASQAYLSLGIAYVGEGQESLAKASFREAAVHDPDLVLSAFEVSPKVRELFQQAKDELAREAAATAAAGPEKKKGGSKLPIILIGVGGAAAAGIAAAGAGARDDESAPPSNARVEIALRQPDVVPLVGLRTEFTAATQNLSLQETAGWSWDFGDGDRSDERGGANHTYMNPGTYEVVATVDWGPVGQTPRLAAWTARLTITVRSLTGAWDGLDAEDGRRFVVQVWQNGATLTGDVDGSGLTGSVHSARVFDIGQFCGGRFEGTVSNDGTRIAGTGSLPCRNRAVQQTLTLRQ